jgi:hypothetical protein
MAKINRSRLDKTALVALILLLGSSQTLGEPADAAATFEAGGLRIRLDPTGRVRSIYDLREQQEYFAENQPAPLLSVDLGTRVEQPAGMVFTGAGQELKLTYAGGTITATVEVKAHATHLTFELTQLSGATPEQVLWGPFPTTIRETIGETVGVARNARFAFGIQGLNLKTSAGAGAAEFGSILRGKTKNRTRERITSSGDVKTVTVPAMTGPDAALEGSRIALFGCRAGEALDVIGRIEVAEGLPHPTLDGVWAKVSPEATRSYLIIAFDTKNLDEVLEIAGRAGLGYIYHMDPFKSWGHFELAPGGFPEGVESLRQCVERAKAVGVRVGVHTLSNFIHPHDPYVSPVPDPRLVCAGSSRLTAAVDETVTTIPIALPEPFRHRQSLSTAVLGQELIRYEAVSEKEPWMLLGCKRGSFRTMAATHPADAAIGKLWDHPYQVFFPNLELQDEITTRLIELFNRTGLRQISFDGLEGCQVTGEGDYAEARFVKKCYDGWKREVISDSSQLKHYTWHIHTRMNWGEPWGKAMREGMPEYRFKNQDYFRRNLLPPMLGWFQIQPASADLEATTLDDVEWVLAKCVGFDAGCAWVTSVETLKRLGEANAILDAIRQWDRARHLKAFSQEQQARMRDANNEFHLEARGESRWQLAPVAFSPRFLHRPVPTETQPAAAAPWEVENRFGEQPLRFVLRVVVDKAGAEDGYVANPTFVVGEQAVTFPTRVAPRQYLVCEGDGQGQLYSDDWRLLATVKPSDVVPTLQAGHRQIRFRCATMGGLRPRVEIRFKTVGSPEPVG